MQAWALKCGRKLDQLAQRKAERICPCVRPPPTLSSFLPERTEIQAGEIARDLSSRLSHAYRPRVITSDAESQLSHFSLPFTLASAQTPADLFRHSEEERHTSRVRVAPEIPENPKQ